MTNGELIRLLQQFPADVEVEAYDVVTHAPFPVVDAVMSALGDVSIGFGIDECGAKPRT